MTRAPCSAAISDAKSPAAPAPTTIRSLGCSGTAGTVPACRSGSDTTPGWRTTSRAIPSAPRGSPRSRPSSIATTGSAGSGSRRRGRRGSSSSGSIRAAHVDGIEALSAAGGGAIDLDTTVAPGTFEAALRAAGGAVALVDSLLAGGRAVRLLGAAPAGPSRHAHACHGLLPAPTWPWLPPRHSSAGGPSGWPSSTGTCTTATAPRPSSRPTRACCSSHCTSGRSTRAPARAADIGPRCGHRHHHQPTSPFGLSPPSARLRHRPCARWCCRRSPSSAPDALLVSSGFDAHRADPLAGMPGLNDEDFGAFTTSPCGTMCRATQEDAPRHRARGRLRRGRARGVGGRAHARARRERRCRPPWTSRATRWRTRRSRAGAAAQSAVIRRM